MVLRVDGPGAYAAEQAALTNIHATQNADSHALILNPMDDRFEAVVHNRGGRAFGVDDEGMISGLWSIGRADLLAGASDWRYDGALNVMQGDYHAAVNDRPHRFDPTRYRDGSHPAGSTTLDSDGDGTDDRHLIFVQMSSGTDGFGQVFVIDRTLDTAALRAYLLPRSPEPVDPRDPAAVLAVGEDFDWADVPATDLRNLVAHSLPRDPDDPAADLSATARLAHDGRRLLARVEVRDDRVRPPGERGRFRGDSVELQLAPEPFADAPTVHVVVTPDGAVFGGEADVEARRTDGGYVVEVAVPWPHAGRFGFDLHVNDRDAGGGLGHNRDRKLTFHGKPAAHEDMDGPAPFDLGAAEVVTETPAEDAVPYRWLFDGYAADWARVTPEFARRYVAADPDVLRLDPIHLPVGEKLIGGNRTFSRPVVCRVGDTLIASYMRRLFHWRLTGEARKNDDSSYSVVTTSTDGGRTWSPPRSLSHELQDGPAAEGATTGNGCVFFVLDEGEPTESVVMVTSSGVYATGDRGATWELYEGALGEEQAPIGANFSRQGVVHPEHGLAFFGHFAARSEDLSERLPYPKDAGPGAGIDRRMLIYTSRDRGRTWAQTIYDPGTPDTAKFIEPTFLLHDGGLFSLSRNMDTAARDPIQAYSADGWFPLDYVTTTDLGVATLGDDTHPDTPDLIHNPVTNRIEAVVCNRSGGGPKNPDAPVKALLLYSLDPADFAAGSTDWTFEGTLLEIDNADGRADGMQPCGSAVDPETGVQHIAVMLGDVHETAGAYLVTRTLDTPRLREALRR